MGISICVPTYNRHNDLKNLIGSIHNGIGEYPYEIIVADGGSTDGAIEYLKSLNDVILIEQGELTGSVKAFNACFKLAKYEYIFWPSDDFTLVPEVLIKSCNLMDRHKDIALVGPNVKEPTFGIVPGFEFCIDYLVLSKTHIFRSSVLKKIGYLDENFRTYFVDDDSSLAVLNLGYTIIFTKEIGVIHNRSHDELWGQNQKIRQERYSQQKKYFQNKWKDFNSNVNEYMKSSFIKKHRSMFFQSLCKEIFARKLTRFIPKKFSKITVKLYDLLLEKSIIFNAKEYNYLKDFYLAQKLPEEFFKDKNC